MADPERPSPEDEPWDPTRTVRMRPERPSAPRRARGSLIVIHGGGHDLGLHAVVESELVVGRAPEAGLRLQDLGVSWRHLRVRRGAGEGYLVEDLGSTNGTRLGDDDLHEARPLADGDKIFVGQTVLRFDLADDLDLGYQTEVAEIVGTDPLTGLESKRRFDDALANATDLARRSKHDVAVLMMDMDGVKRINDTHGHFFGAHAIGETGRLIAGVLGAAGQACRFGGDEFCAFLAPSDLPSACAVAEQIRTTLEAAVIQKEGIRLAPTISIGVAAGPTGNEGPEDLVARADAALYRAKRAGKNRVSV